MYIYIFNECDLTLHDLSGKAKAEAAVATLNKKIPGFNYVAHYKKIQDYDEAFYSQFNIVICGLDSVEARRWINSMLLGNPFPILLLFEVSDYNVSF